MARRYQLLIYMGYTCNTYHKSEIFKYLQKVKTNTYVDFEIVLTCVCFAVLYISYCIFLCQLSTHTNLASSSLSDGIFFQAHGTYGVFIQDPLVINLKFQN